MRTTTTANRLNDGYSVVKGKKPSEDRYYSSIPSTDVHKGDLFLVQTSDIIPIDGEIVEGVASMTKVQLLEKAPSDTRIGRR